MYNYKDVFIKILIIKGMITKYVSFFWVGGSVLGRGNWTVYSKPIIIFVFVNFNLKNDNFTW